ncbi:MAG TPA: site-specific integrase [Blastocatellia bacterium]|nr:site-specific integrase [Blastocatellia bacterium]HMZ20394.1 site-specific integrase [Blastocatellia bacterium]HNG31863.1 site-specific integrase [Blastocatellia bacterium]
MGIKATKRGPVPRFDAAMKEFLAWSEIEHADKPETARRYRVSSRALLLYFGSSKIDRIDGAAVEEFKDARRVQKALPKKTKHKKPKPTQRIKPATVNRELACLKAMFYYFVRKKLLVENPVSDVKMLPEEREFYILTPEEEQEYLAACSQPLRDIATLAIETGMRPEEIYGMRISDIRLAKNYYFNSEGKTPSARRRVPLTTRARQVVEDRLASVEGDYLFPGLVEDTHIVKANAAHQGALKRSGLPRFRIYDLRHTFATRFVEAGGDLVTLAQILGHRDLRMVMVYSHPTDPHKQASMKKFEAYNRANRAHLRIVPMISPNVEDSDEESEAVSA